jgi:hypothetical protein
MAIKSATCDGNSLCPTQKEQLYKNSKLKVSPAVSAIKQDYERLDIRLTSNRMEKATKNDAVGDFEQLNRCARQFIAPVNIDRSRNGEPFLLDFELGFGGTFQLVVATTESLDHLTNFGLEHFLSDSRWLGPTDAKVCNTGALVRDTNGIYRAVAASFSSVEDSKTSSRFVDAMHRCRRCCPECDHPLEAYICTLTRLTWTRRCLSPDDQTVLDKQVGQLTSIDKDSVAKLGFDGKVAVDIFHHMKAFGAKLKELGVSNSSLLAGINQLHRVVLR